MFSTWIFAITSTPKTIDWNVSVSLIMILCNLFALIIGRYFIQKPGQGPALPVPKAEVWDSFGVPELLATTSFGHILGAGIILGLANAGVL